MLALFALRAAASVPQETKSSKFWCDPIASGAIAASLARSCGKLAATWENLCFAIVRAQQTAALTLVLRCKITSPRVCANVGTLGAAEAAPALAIHRAPPGRRARRVAVRVVPLVGHHPPVDPTAVRHPAPRPAAAHEQNLMQFRVGPALRGQWCRRKRCRAGRRQGQACRHQAKAERERGCSEACGPVHEVCISFRIRDRHPITVAIAQFVRKGNTWVTPSFPPRRPEIRSPAVALRQVQIVTKINYINDMLAKKARIVVLQAARARPALIMLSRVTRRARPASDGLERTPRDRFQ